GLAVAVAVVVVQGQPGALLVPPGDGLPVVLLDPVPDGHGEGAPGGRPLAGPQYCIGEAAGQRGSGSYARSAGSSARPSTRRSGPAAARAARSSEPVGTTQTRTPAARAVAMSTVMSPT